MKIAFVSEHFNPACGGQETYMNDFTKFLIKEGHEVHFFTQDAHRDKENLYFHQVKISGFFSNLRFLQWVVFAKEAKRQADLEGVDIIMGTGKCLGVNVFQPHGGTVRASHRQNAILVRNGFHTFLKKLSNFFSPKHIVAKNIESKQYANKDCQFVAISEMVKGHMKEFYNLSDDQITLVYNGIDTSRFSPVSEGEKLEARKKLGLSATDTIFSTVAHNFKLKGIREVIEALAELKKKRDDFKFVVAGNGKQKKFKKLAEDLGVSEQVVFLGGVEQPELVYQSSDAYLQATWYDPCSLVVLESLAAGLPTVTTKFNGAGEFIDSGKDGYVISRPDAREELSEVLLKLFDKSHREELSKAGREKIKDQTLEKNFCQMIAVFEKAIR